MTTRKTYTKEFKLNAVNLVLEQGQSRADVARALEIGLPMLSRWINEYKNEIGLAFRPDAKLTPEQEEIKQLKAKVEQLEEEKVILKKATALFAKDVD